MNRFLIASGNKDVYTPLHRELFWDTGSQELYIYNTDHWLLIGGEGKQNYSEAGDNLEIIFDENDTDKLYPTIRLKDDIDVDTVELGKFSDTIRWKGMIKLGEVTNSSFFSLMQYSTTSGSFLGGKFLAKISRGGQTEYGIYQATCSAIARGSIFGSDSKNVKFTLNRVTYNSSKTYVGFRTFNYLKTVTVDSEDRIIYSPPEKIEVWFNGWDGRIEQDKNILQISGDDFKSSKVFARN